MFGLSGWSPNCSISSNHSSLMLLGRRFPHQGQNCNTTYEDPPSITRMPTSRNLGTYSIGISTLTVWRFISAQQQLKSECLTFLVVIVRAFVLVQRVWSFYLIPDPSSQGACHVDWGERGSGERGSRNLCCVYCHRVILFIPQVLPIVLHTSDNRATLQRSAVVVAALDIGRRGNTPNPASEVMASVPGFCQRFS